MFTGELHPVPGNSLQQHRQKNVEATLVPQEGLAEHSTFALPACLFPASSPQLLSHQGLAPDR